MHTNARAVSLVAAALWTLAGAARAQQYAPIDLGNLGGPAAFGFGVNSAGHAVGASARLDINFHGLYFEGAALDIVPLAGDRQSWCVAINNSDVAAAISYNLGGLAPHGMLWHDGTVTGLGDFSPRALNTLGTVAGSRNTADATFGRVDHAALWSAGVTTDLGTLGGSSSYAAGIDSANRVVGWSFTARDLAVHAALWMGGPAMDLGTLGGAGGQAYAVNSAGVIVGMGQTPAGLWHAMLLTIDSAGTVILRQDLGVLPGASTSAAYAVNSTGQVVGTSNSRAFLWRAGTMTDLNTLIPPPSEWLLERAWGVSDNGFIVGSGLYQGQPHAFLLAVTCYANCDSSSQPPILNVADFTCFLQRFAAGDPYANCDASTTPPVLNVMDFSCFLQRYAGGCP